MFDALFFFEVLIGGLLSGVMYSLVALGFVLIFKASGVFNFAQGALVLFAALTFVFLVEYGEGGAIWTWTGSLALALAGLAALFYWVSRSAMVAKRPQAANWSLVGILLVATIGLAAVFGNNSDMWRAAFITLLTFLVLVLGANRPRSAVAVLLGLAAVCLLPVA